jgi:hypothetical protein
LHQPRADVQGSGFTVPPCSAGTGAVLLRRHAASSSSVEVHDIGSARAAGSPTGVPERRARTLPERKTAR